MKVSDAAERVIVMWEVKRWGQSRDPFSAGQVYWLRALATCVISVALAVAVEAARAVA